MILNKKQVLQATNGTRVCDVCTRVMYACDDNTLNL